MCVNARPAKSNSRPANSPPWLSLISRTMKGGRREDHLANPGRMALEAMASALIIPRRSIISAGRSKTSSSTRAFPGPYNRNLFPYFDEIFARCRPTIPAALSPSPDPPRWQDHDRQRFHLRHDGDGQGTFLYAHPTEDNARRWSKIKLPPMAAASRRCARISRNDLATAPDSVLYKERRDGNLSAADLRRQFAGIAVADHDRLPGPGRSRKVGDEHRRRSRDAGR